MQSLRTLRTAAGMSQAALAEKAGLSAGVVSQIEVGRITSPTLDTLDRLAGALGVSLITLADSVRASAPEPPNPL